MQGTANPVERPRGLTQGPAESRLTAACSTLSMPPQCHRDTRAWGVELMLPAPWSERYTARPRPLRLSGNTAGCLSSYCQDVICLLVCQVLWQIVTVLVLAIESSGAMHYTVSTLCCAGQTSLTKTVMACRPHLPVCGRRMEAVQGCRSAPLSGGGGVVDGPLDPPCCVNAASATCSASPSTLVASMNGKRRQGRRDTRRESSEHRQTTTLRPCRM